MSVGAAAATGAVCTARVGVEGIPGVWKNQLENRQDIEKLALLLLHIKQETAK